MRLNTLTPGIGAKRPKTRVGRGVGSGIGKTCGRGHKGQKARAGGYHKVGFEGGQMPLQRRLPKVGFTSLAALKRTEVRLSDLEKLNVEVIDLALLIEANIIRHDMLDAKIIATGELTKKVTIRGLRVTKGARAAIERVGGKVE